MIDVIINSYNEPKSTLRAVNVFLKQYSGEDMRVIVVDPFPEVEEFLKENIGDKRFYFFLDSGEGKSYSLNLIFQEFGSNNPDDIFILTDGDVFVSDNSVEEILKAFENKEIGCVTGRPVSVDKRNEKYGYWSHLVFEGIHQVRKKLSTEKKFFECSGFLFAIRKAVIFDFPLAVSEDSIIPFLFWKKNYRIVYVHKAEVYVKNPGNWNDWLVQKTRNVKGHENLSKVAPEMPRTKSLFNEIKHGWHFFFTYPKNVKEMLWTAELYFARLYLYWKSFREIRVGTKYSDGWREVETKSTRME